MRLRLPRFLHLIPVSADRVLIVDAISQNRLVVTRDFAESLQHFVTPQDVAPSENIRALVERGILTEKTAEEELSEVSALLAPFHGRDPEALLEKFRREAKQGVEPYWAATAALGSDDLAAGGRKVSALLFGDCDVQMESDFLRRTAAKRGIDLAIVASFPNDLRLASERPHDVILIGALWSRQVITEPRAAPGEPPHHAYIAQARMMIEGLRRVTAAPILIDNLPEPTVQPLGLAERGADGHRNRFRSANLALADMVEAYADVHLVDVAAALSAAGSERLLDDGLVGFTHFGSPGWMLQRPESEKAAVHGVFPDLAPLAALVDGDPYGREAVVAQAHCDAMVTVLGIDRKKCVIVDLDGLLWPGVLAETGAPFAYHPSAGGPYSYVGLYFGLHEALLCLKKRGILLATVSKNDEAAVRQLWRYQDHYPTKTLLKPEDLVTSRINWNDKVENIRSIADELGFALDSFLFLDDNPVERERVKQRLPEVEVWGEDPFLLRRRLLTDPRLQWPHVTTASADRTELTKAQLARQATRAESVSEEDFLASLEVRTRFERLGSGLDLARVSELFQRTTQFNTTGVKLSVGDLEALVRTPSAAIFVAHVADRFGDHGLVGAAVVRDCEIVGLVLSCRVLGLGVEHLFLRHVLAALPGECSRITARIIPTLRNGPVRNLYQDNGFSLGNDGVWMRARAG